MPTAVYSALLTFTTYHLPLTTYHLPLLPLTTYHLPLTTYHLPTRRLGRWPGGPHQVGRRVGLARDPPDAAALGLRAVRGGLASVGVQARLARVAIRSLAVISCCV